MSSSKDRHEMPLAECLLVDCILDYGFYGFDASLNKWLLLENHTRVNFGNHNCICSVRKGLFN